MQVDPDDKLSTAKIVGVISTQVDLHRATRMRNPPDLFELRLDALCGRKDEVRTNLGDLRAPLIITARHPDEGGSNQLSVHKRRTLLLRFLPDAAYVDIELRSAAGLADVIDGARAKGVRTIISFHDFKETPSHERLDEIARTAQSLGAYCLKVATRTDTSPQLARLLEFFKREQRKMRVAAMGIGRLGMTSRRKLFRQGSILNYAHLDRTTIAGQPSVSGIRRWLLVEG